MGVVLMRRNAPQESTEFWPEMNPEPTATGITVRDAHIDPNAAERTTATIPRTTLFGIPHAGGSAMYYTQLKHFLPDHVDFQPLEMAGRGRRSREPLATSMETIGKDLFERMAPVARTSPYAIFGHSMGGFLALLCAFQTFEAGLPLPKALFLSACAPPDVFAHKSSLPVSSFTADQLWKYVTKLGGIPPSVATSGEFCRYLEPILYADFAALDNWTPGPLSPLPVPITVFLGDQDALCTQTALKWQKYTTRDFAMHSFRGNHFYLQDNWESLATHMTQTLARLHREQ